MNLQPHPEPIQCPGGYSLDLYCKWNNPRHAWNPCGTQYEDFYGEHGGDVRSQARRVGWILHRDGTATCPKCAKELKR